MWFLKRMSDREIRYLLVGKPYTVGRKDADILILNDPSISRKHSVINLSHPEASLNNIGRLPVLTIKDIGSKYGTYVNDIKVDSDAVILKVGDKVTFGQCDSSFQLCYEPLVITTSCIEKEEKQQLKSLVQRLGGHILSEWSKDCTYLVMKELKVTIKAVCALLSLKPVVTKEYFENLITHIEGNKNLPENERFIPLLGEPLLDKEKASFHCKKERQNVFQDKTFVCTSLKQYKKLEAAIKLGGGKVVFMDAQNEAMKSLILHPDTCVMKHQPDSSQGTMPLPDDLAKLEEELKNNRKRTIPESDIGLAVVYCSTQHYCNPDFNMASSLFATTKLHSQTFSQQDVYVEDTQPSTGRSTLNRNKSKFGSYLSDTFERSKQVHSPSPNNENKTWDMSLSIGHNEIQNPSDVGSQLVPKKERHCSEPENPTKRVKLQDVAVKEEVYIDLCDEEHTESNQEVKIKPEVVTPLCNKSTVAEGHWNEFPLGNAQTSVLKEENNGPPSPGKSPTEKNMIDMTNNHHSEESAMLSSPIEGFLSKSFHCLANITNRPIREEQVIDKELPTKVVRIEFASLCQKRNTHPQCSTDCQQNSNISVRNFKKFRKVYSTGNRLPVIIGGPDLVVYKRNAFAKADSLMSENSDSHSQEDEEIGLFDWDANKRAR